MKTIRITSFEAHQSILKYVKKYLKNTTLNFIEKLFRKKDIKVNDHWVHKTYILQENDVLKIFVDDEQINQSKKNKKNKISSDFVLNIIFEDDNILILNKKKGILVHADKNEKKITLNNEVINYFNIKNNRKIIGNFQPAPCHRLDRNTSGLIIFAKNMETLQVMDLIFKHRKIKKYYLALVYGKVVKDGEINKPLKKDEKSSNVLINKKGKVAITQYHVLKKFHNYSLLEINLITGRTHQIRVHMASINHPVVGDRKYGNFKINKIFEKQFKYHFQFLHAYKIQFKEINDEKLKYLSNRTFISELNEQEKQMLKDIN